MDREIDVSHYSYASIYPKEIKINKYDLISLEGDYSDSWEEFDILLSFYTKYWFKDEDDRIKPYFNNIKKVIFFDGDFFMVGIEVEKDGNNNIKRVTQIYDYIPVRISKNIFLDILANSDNSDKEILKMVYPSLDLHNPESDDYKIPKDIPIVLDEGSFQNMIRKIKRNIDKEFVQNIYQKINNKNNNVSYYLVYKEETEFNNIKSGIFKKLENILSDNGIIINKDDLNFIESNYYINELTNKRSFKKNIKDEDKKKIIKILEKIGIEQQYLLKSDLFDDEVLDKVRAIMLKYNYKWAKRQDGTMGTEKFRYHYNWDGDKFVLEEEVFKGIKITFPLSN